MNERIHDLAMLARKHFPKTETSVEFWVLDEEKFAELIVQECIREIGYKSVELLDIDFYPHYQERLKKYFGVE